MNAESILAMLDCQIADREDRARRYIRKAGKERKRRGAPQTTAERMSEYHCHRLDELKQIRAWVASRAPQPAGEVEEVGDFGERFIDSMGWAVPCSRAAAYVNDLRKTALALAAAEAGQYVGARIDVVSAERGFEYDGNLQVHTPTLLLKFRAVSAIGNGDPNAKGWKDRDELARRLSAQQAGDGKDGAA